MSSTRKPFLIVIQPFDHGVPNFGPMTIGSVRKSDDGKQFDAFVYNQKIATFKRHHEAVKAAHDYWHQNCSSKALTSKFKVKTRGGQSCRLLHATDDSIVAVIGQGIEAFSTSFDKNGACKMSDSRHLDLMPVNAS